MQRWHDSEESIGEGQSNQDQVIRIILIEYIDVLSQIHTDADPAAQKDIVAEGFKVAAYLEGSTIQRAMIENIARAAARSPELATLGRKEQNTRRQLVALRILYADILALPPGETDMGAIEDLRNRLSAVSDEHGRLSNELERQFPAYAELLNPKPATLDQARKFLGADEALIVTLVGEDKTYVWAVPKRGRTEFSAVPLGLNNIGEKVRTLRKALAPPVIQTLSDIPAFDVNLAHDLYKSLLAPIAKGWKSAKSLLVVASGPLGQLPFSLLVSEPTPLGKERAPLLSRYRNIAWLVRNHAVTILPSVSTLITLRNKSGPTRARRAFVGFGDPLFSLAQVTATSKKAKNLSSNKVTARGLPAARRLALHLREAPQLRGLQSAKLSQLPRLPDTAAEIIEIALSLGADLKRDVYLGERASEDQVKNMSLADYKVVAFATHGLIPGDLDGLRQPALAMTSPEVIGGKNDGLLTMGEILSLKLDADWVVLSACNTSSGQSAGAEAVSGLGRAFFYAGTRALLVSHWPVETTSAKALTTDIFARQAKDTSLTRAAALRQSKLNLIDKRGMMDDRGRMVFSYAHPIFWAPFSIVGDGGGGKQES